jgi:L-asparaginase II
MLQAIPVILSGAADRFGFTEAEIAICCASHSAADYHLEAVKGVLGKIGLSEADLRCGVHAPSDQKESERLVLAGASPNQLHNNCSGKHAGMLAVCLAKGWPIENYLDPDHPLQQWILDIVAEYTGLDRSEIPSTTDGCSLPTFYVPLSALATAIARFVAKGAAGDPAARRILDAVAHYPEMIYERGGFDSELIRVLGGKGIAKRGAMAIFAAGIESPAHGAIGVVVEMEDGNITPMSPIVMRALEKLGLLDADQLAELAGFRITELDNCRSIHVGEIVADFELAKTE